MGDIFLSSSAFIVLLSGAQDFSQLIVHAMHNILIAFWYVTLYCAQYNVTCQNAIKMYLNNASKM